MQGLYKKVNKGIYPRIPKQYSKDLSLLIKMMLAVDPNKRPSCHDLLNMPIIQHKAKILTPNIYQSLISEKSNKDKLLKTIYVPNYAGKQKDKNEKSKAPGAEQLNKVDHFVRYI